MKNKNSRGTRFHSPGPGFRFPVRSGRVALPGNTPPAPALTPAELGRALALYTAIRSTREGARRRVEIERGNEEASQLKKFDRLEAISLGRDLNRNNPKAITIINQRSILTAGRVRAQFNTPDEAWNERADTVFNRYFARDCFHDYPAHLAKIAQLVEAAKMREGDILLAFDDFLLDSGKLLIWEADQLVTVAPGDWDDPEKNPDWREPSAPGEPAGKPFFQDQGIICDQYRRVVGYAVSALPLADETRASLTLPLSDVLILPAERARLVSHRFRVGQRRGVPSLLPVAANLSDIDEMLKSELSTARMRSKIMAWVKHSADSGVPDDMARFAADLRERLGAADPAGGASSPGEASLPDPSGSAAPGAGEVDIRTDYRKISEATGGLLEYLDDGDSVEIPNIDRPNLDAAAFYEALGDSAGASQGLARAFTRCAATASYTAHRGETCMTDRHIRSFQKDHEHDWLDWLAVKVIRRAISRGSLPEGPADWEYMVSWEMPRPDAIDPEKEAKADLLNLKNGKITFRDIAGPSWRKKFDELAGQVGYAGGRIPLAVLETVAGAPALSAENSGKEPEQEEKGDSDDEL